MKTDTTKFLAVLAVFAMAFAGFAAVAVAEQNDAELADDIEAMIELAKEDGAVNVTDYGEDGITLKADGYIYDSEGTKTTLEWKNGFYSTSGDIKVTIPDEVTVVIDATACGIAATNGTITIEAATSAALTINVNGVADTGTHIMAGGIIASGDVTISNIAMQVACNASASMATGAGSYGILSYGAVAINNCTGTIYGGSQGIFANTAITIEGKSLTVAGYERGLRANGNITIGQTTATTVIANIIDGDGVNGEGEDQRFGVKTDGTVTVGAAGVSSTLTTMGLYTTTSITLTAGTTIVVLGGYEQTASGNTFVGYYDVAATYTENAYLKHVSSASGAVAGYINIVEGADVYKYTIPGYSKIEVPAAESTTEDIQALLAADDESVVYLDLKSVSSTAAIMDGLVIPKGMEVRVIETATANTDGYTGTIDLSNDKSAIVLDGITLSTTGMTFTNGDSNSAKIVPSNAAEVNMTLAHGSVVIKDITTTTNLTVTVSGDVKIVGSVALGATVTIVKGDSAANVIISSDLYNFGQIEFGEVTITAYDEITNEGALVFGDKTIIGSQVIINGGNIAGTIDGSTLVLKGQVTAAADITVNGKMTIGEGASLGMGDHTLTISKDAKLNVYGELAIGDNGAVVNNGTIYVLSKSAEIPSDISGTGTIEFDVIEEIVEIKGNIRTSMFDDYQAVYITGDSTIVEDSLVLVQGKIIVNPGVTLTITDGSMLVVLNSYGKIVNYGKIVVLAGGEADNLEDEDYPEGLIVSNATFENYGEIQFDYTPATGTTALYSGSFFNNAIIRNYGDFVIYESNIVDLGASAIAEFVNYTDATLTISGQIDFTGENPMTAITNYGEVVVNGIIESTDNVTINQVANGASVLITKLAGDAAAGKLTISDARIADVTGKTFAGTNSIVITDSTVDDSFSGLMVTTTTKMGSTANYVYMDIAGALDVENSAEDAVAKVDLSGDYVTMNTVMTMTKEVTLTGKLTVNGLMTLEDGSKYNTSGAVTVYGALVTGIKPIDPAITVNAAMFVTGTTEKTYTYTTLDKAIAGAEEADVDLITATGNVAVTDSIEIPAGMTVKQLSGAITIGSSTNTSVVLTVEDGAKIDQTAGNILVYGTLYVENKSTGIKKSPSVTADVKEESATALIYTNLANALSITPTEPTTVTLFKDVEVTTDLTIPEFVTLDTNEKSFTVKGATLTINGMLYLNGGSYNVEDVEGTITKEGKIVLNGYIKNADFMTYTDGKKYPAGAYFSVSDSGTFYYITPVSIAASYAMIADDNTISIYGKNTVGTVSFEGTADEPVYINVNGDIASGTFELSLATMTIAAGVNINMTVSDAAGSIAFKNAKAEEKAVITSSAILGIPVLSMTAGKIVNNSSVAATKYNTTFDGDVILKNVSILKGVIDGTTAVAGTVAFTGTTVVNDTLIVESACAMTMESVVVYGNLTAAEATSTKSAGSIVISGTLIAGDNEYAGSDAVISGNVSAAYYIVFNGTTFEGKVSETIADLMDVKKYTEFYVLDELWFTYLFSGAVSDIDIVEVGDETVTYNFQPEGLEDSVFSAWQKVVSGELVTITTATQVGDVQAVYALIDYEIYGVEIVTDSGIKSVAINGVQMEYENNVFFMDELTAGTYKVTYTLKSGYEGTAVLSTMTGIILKDNSFALSGTDAEDLNVRFQLAGTEPIPEPEPTPAPEKESEWTITTILLVILVILIAIMAVIVALRLNRS